MLAHGHDDPWSRVSNLLGSPHRCGKLRPETQSPEGAVPDEKLAIYGGEPVRTKPFGSMWIFGEEERRHLTEVMDRAPKEWRSRFKVNEFAAAFAERHGVEYAIPTDSGTGGLHAAIAAINPNPGDEIVTTPISDVGTVLGIIAQNAIPIFADMNPDTFNIDPADVERKITERTRAILIVHLFGNPCDMDEIMDIGRRHGLPVIEDCSQAHLAEYKGGLVGTIGDIAAYSLGGKALTTDQGGMVITNNPELARRAVGFTRKGSEMDENLEEMLGPTSFRWGSARGYAFLGTQSPMTDLEAAVGLAQLGRWDEATETRRMVAAMIDEALYELPGIHVQQIRPGNRSSYYVYGYRIDEEEAGVSTEQFAEAVKAEGIPDCNGAYIRGMPLYKYPLFAEEQTYGDSRYPFVDEQGNRRVDYRNLHLPNIDRVLPNTGTILFRNTYTEEDGRDIARALRKVALHYSAH